MFEVYVEVADGCIAKWFINLDRTGRFGLAECQRGQICSVPSMLRASYIVIVAVVASHLKKIDFDLKKTDGAGELAGRRGSGGASLRVARGPLTLPVHCAVSCEFQVNPENKLLNQLNCFLSCQIWKQIVFIIYL